MDTASVVRSTAIFYTSEHLLSRALSRGSLRLTDDNVRGPLIRPNTHRISYDPLSRPIHYPDTNSDDHSFALSLRSCAPRYVLCTVIRAQRARTPFVLVINTCARCKLQRSLQIPQRWNVIFARGSPRWQISNSRFPAGGQGRSITRIRYSRYPPAIIHCVYAYDPPSLVGSHAPLLLHTPAAIRHPLLTFIFIILN